MNAEVLFDDVCSDDPARVAAALQAAHGRAEELTPLLIERLNRALVATRDPEGEMVPFAGFLFYLAADFKARTAHALLIQLLRMSPDLIDDVLGDVMTAGAGIALADTYPGSPDAIYGLIEDSAADPFARGAGLMALAILWKRGAILREELLSRMVRLASLLNPKSGDDVMVGNLLLDTAVKVNVHEIRGTILDLYDRGLAEETYYESEYAEKQLQPDSPPEHEADSLNATIDDAWAAVKDWSFFKPDAVEVLSDELPFLDALNPVEPSPTFNERSRAYTPPIPFLAPPKVGRNEPCPCGSGKKFKKCCGQ